MAIRQLGQIDNLRFPGGILQHGNAIGKGCGHHQVLGPTHGGDVHEDVRTFETPIHPRHHITILDADFRAHRTQTHEVLIHRTRTDGTPTGQ